MTAVSSIPSSASRARLRAVRVGWRALAVSAIVMPLSLAVRAGEAGDKNDPRSWLQRIATAANERSYTGTMVSSVGSHVSSSRVARYCTGKDNYEQLESLDGPPRMIYRHNRLVHTLWPLKKVAVVEQRDALTPLTDLPTGNTDALASYALHLEGSDRVAGHPSQVMRLEPRDPHRYAQRLWADARTGLMLRADVLDLDGRVLESSAFADLKIGVAPQPEAVAGVMHKLGGYQVVKADIARTKLENEGWRLDPPVTGFKQVSCVKRPVDGSEARSGTPMLVQSIYSDGLVHVSVFIEPFVAARHQPKMSSWGGSHTLALQRGDAWITVVGDVPMDTIKRFASALERLK